MSLFYIQALYRSRLARKRYNELRTQRAALIIQSSWRMHVAQSAYDRKRAAAVALQNVYRWGIEKSDSKQT